MFVSELLRPDKNKWSPESSLSLQYSYPAPAHRHRLGSQERLLESDNYPGDQYVMECP